MHEYVFSHDVPDTSIACLLMQVEHAKIIKIVQNISKLVPLEFLLNQTIPPTYIMLIFLMNKTLFTVVLDF